MVKSINQGRWTEEEHSKFIRGKNMKLKWEEIAEIIGTRNAEQCRSHNQKMSIQTVKKNYGCPAMVEKGTQYEVPISFYTSRPVILLESSNVIDESIKYSYSAETMPSDNEFLLDLLDSDDCLDLIDY